MDSIIKIPIGNNKFTLIDLCDSRFTKYKWRDVGGYACRREKYKNIFLHKEILGLSSSHLQVDHKDLNKFNNTRNNLRPVTSAQNGQNVPGHEKTSKYRGVSYVKDRNKWRAQQQFEGKHYNLGNYDKEIIAAKYAESFRRKHMIFSIPDYIFDPIPECKCNICKGQK